MEDALQGLVVIIIPIVMCYYPSKCGLWILKITKNGLDEYFHFSKPPSQTLSHDQYFFFLRTPGVNICEGNYPSCALFYYNFFLPSVEDE